MPSSSYLSYKFMNNIWPKFTVEFKNPESIRVYLVDIGQFADFIEKDVLEATQEDADCYMQYLFDQRDSGKLKVSTIRKKHHELSALYNFLWKYKKDLGLHSTITNFFLKHTPHDETEKIKDNRVLTPKQLDDLFGYLKGNDFMCFMASLFSFKGLLSTGEFMRIRKYDVGTNDDNILIRKDLIQKKEHIDNIYLRLSVLYRDEDADEC